MKFTLALAAGCAILAAAPASAQVLGGGGLGGQLGGSLGGRVGGPLGGNVGGSANGSVGGVTSGLGGNLGGDVGTAANVNRGDARFGAGAAVALDASTSASVSPGMIVRDTSGRAIGRVQQLQTTARGAVRGVLVRVGDRVAALPAANFGLSGDVLVSAMGRADVRREAQRQQAGQQQAGRSRSADGGAVRED